MKVSRWPLEYNVSVWLRLEGISAKERGFHLPKEKVTPLGASLDFILLYLAQELPHPGHKDALSLNLLKEVEWNTTNHPLDSSGGCLDSLGVSRCSPNNLAL